MSPSQDSAGTRSCRKCRKCRKCRSIKPLLVVGALGLAVAAVVKELRRPQGERTGHGFVAGVVPYDFRVPTLDRIKEGLWDPEGPVLQPHLFGVGWSVNLGRLVAEAKSLVDRSAP